MNPTRWTQFYRVFPGTPVYDDETLAVYDIANPLPFAYDGLPVHLTPGAALARFDIVPDEAYSEWRFQVVARLVDERTAPLACRIQLAGENGDVLASPLTLFGPLPEDESWMAGDLQVLETVVHLQDLDPGDYHWSIACPQATTYTAPETLTVSDAGQITYLRHRIDTDYGGVIRLQGYRWRTPGAELLVTLRWETLEPPGQDYKVFVHLLNSDGEIARQHDSAPCDWQCPTGQWQKGELVLDQSNIYLGGLEPGDYRLAVGLYDAQTGERLAAVGPDGQRYPDDYVFLPDVLDIRSSDDARAVFLPALDLGDR
jgi:hypothetical protein